MPAGARFFCRRRQRAAAVQSRAVSPLTAAPAARPFGKKRRVTRCAPWLTGMQRNASATFSTAAGSPSTQAVHPSSQGMDVKSNPSLGAVISAETSVPVTSSREGVPCRSAAIKESNSAWSKPAAHTSPISAPLFDRGMETLTVPAGCSPRSITPRTIHSP